jgi:hypothetical protein
LVSFLGVAIIGPFLNYTIFELPGLWRLAVAAIFMTFAAGMILALSQIFTHIAFGYASVLNWRYKKEVTFDPDAIGIA